MTESMVERVARARYEAWCHRVIGTRFVQWTEMDLYTKQALIEDERVAIQAMCKSSETMINVGAGVLSGADEPFAHYPRILLEPIVAEVFKAMINAALEEDQGVAGDGGEKQ
jgi:hypothetical protein